ncbi:MAG: TIGR03118 family protein [Terracidiphilus sp.]
MLVRRTLVAPCLGLVFLVASALAHAQYHLTNLVSNQVDSHAPTIDPLLANPWGLARSAGSPWWLSDNDTGWSTLYTAAGVEEALKVVVPTAGNGPVEAAGLNGPGTPTGIVYNGSKTDFQVSGTSSSFIFATLDGTISAWPGLNKNLATLVVDNSASKASYTGLAITSNASGNLLYAADNANNKIDMFDGNFNLVESFGDPAVPSTFSVFGVQDINGMVYVTYAVPNVGAGGYVDIFKEDGTFVKTLIKGPTLNQAWGVALAPANFGPLSNTLLVSNNSVDGTINGFNATTGKFVGTMRDEHGRPIVLNNLWGVAFGGGATANGATNELFVTVGQGIGTAELAGTFASIVFNPSCNLGGEGSTE